MGEAGTNQIVDPGSAAPASQLALTRTAVAAVVTGRALDAFTCDADWDAVLTCASVLFVEISPAHKEAVVRHCKRRGDVVTVTGARIAMDDGSVQEGNRSLTCAALWAHAGEGGGGTPAAAGDSIHDTPALRLADVAVALGVKGTDVSRAAASLIAHDDNFVTVVAAVAQGARWQRMRLREGASRQRALTARVG